MKWVTNRDVHLEAPIAPVVTSGDAELAQLRLDLTRVTDERNRLHDLVRHQRGELHDADLITDDEYAALAEDHDMVKRLEGYDTLRARADALADACDAGAWDHGGPRGVSGEGVSPRNLSAPKVREPANGTDPTQIHYAGLALLDFATMCGACWPDWTPEPVKASALVTCKGCIAVAEWALSATTTTAPEASRAQ